MSSWQRISIHSNRKVTDNFESKTTKDARTEKYPKDLYQMFHLNAHNSLLEQTLEEPNPNDVQAIKPYAGRIAFFTTELNDPNFDVLTPDFEQTMLQETVIEVQLCPDKFVFLNKRTGSVLPYEYRHEFMPFLVAVESGIVTRELYHLFQLLKGNEKDKTLYKNGKMPISIIDFRIVPEKSYYTELSLSPDILCEYEKNATTNIDNYYSFSKLTNLTICTDPSQDVSRYFSCIDWREKMWRKDRKVEDDPKLPESREERKPPTIPVVNVEDKGRLEISQDLLTRLSNSIPGF